MPECECVVRVRVLDLLLDFRSEFAGDDAAPLERDAVLDRRSG